MNVEAIESLGMHDEVGPAAAVRVEASTAGGPTFMERVAGGLQEVNLQLLASQADLQRLAVGDADSVHDVMIRLEESRISLQLMLQVRNRVLEAYQDVMRMQI
ncbi:MAG TPA: flagellar hook-basal body complex protein FliE [Ramlibacter sp.]